MAGTLVDDTDLVYDQAISLGGSCQPAWHLRKNRLRSEAYPLDWINTRNSTDALCTVLRTRFAGFFDKSCFELTDIFNRKNEYAFRHKRYGFLFWHEFKNISGFENHFEERRALYERRIQRMLCLLDGHPTVLFVRFRTSREDSGKLAETLSETFPRVRFTILALDDTDEIRKDWEIPHVVNRYIECAPNFDATNPDFDHHWTERFDEFSIAPQGRERWRWPFSKKNPSFID